MKKILSLSIYMPMKLFLCLVVFSLIVFSDFTSYASDNLNKQNYSMYGHCVRSYINKTDNGFELIDTGQNPIIIKNLNNDLTVVSEKKLFVKNYLIGGFFSGKDFNFIVTGTTNAEKDDTKEVVTVTKYTKDWEEISHTGISDCYTVNPFLYGSLRMTEFDKFLYIRTCHLRYDGHQSNMNFSINKETMELVDKDGKPSSDSFGYAAHSFNQFIDADEDSVYAIDHSDGYPRGIQFNTFYEKIPELTPEERKDFYKKVLKNMGYIASDEFCESIPAYEPPEFNGKFFPGKSLLLYHFAGTIGSNYTNASIGGFELGKNNVIVAGNSIDQENPSNKQYNIFVITVSKDRKNLNFKWLTDLTTSVSTPVMTKINDNAFFIMWREGTEGNLIKSVIIDENGTEISPVTEFNAMLSDCKPLLVNNKIYWFVTSNDTEYIYIADVSDYSNIKLSVKENYDHSGNKGGFYDGDIIKVSFDGGSNIDPVEAFIKKNSQDKITVMVPLKYMCDKFSNSENVNVLWNAEEKKATVSIDDNTMNITAMSGNFYMGAGMYSCMPPEIKNGTLYVDCDCVEQFFKKNSYIDFVNRKLIYN